MLLDRLLHLGDLGLTIPVAAGIGAALAVSGAWRMAAWWSLLFGLAIALVGASKIAFLGWGNDVQALDAKAISGHAATVTALAPMLFYLALSQQRTALAAWGIGIGLAIGGAMALLLVTLRQHSLAEALAGCLVGAVASLSTIGLRGSERPARPLSGLFAFVLTFLVAAWLMRSAPVGYWMIRLAQLLSGRTQVFSWGAAQLPALLTTG